MASDQRKDYRSGDDDDVFSENVTEERSGEDADSLFDGAARGDIHAFPGDPEQQHRRG